MFPIKKRFELLILIILSPLTAAVLSIFLHANFFVSLILFFGIPSAYLAFKQPKYIVKAILFSLSSILVFIPIDYIAHFNKTWFIPSVLSYRLFNYVSLEGILWTIMHVFFVIMFYEYFLDKHIINKWWYKRTKYLFLMLFSILAIFLAIFLFSKEYLRVPYWYIMFGSVFVIIPVVLQAFRFPRVTLKIFKVLPYFFLVNFIYEITALKLGQWSFPGTEYIGWVSFFWNTIPV